MTSYENRSEETVKYFFVEDKNENEASAKLNESILENVCLFVEIKRHKRDVAGLSA